VERDEFAQLAELVISGNGDGARQLTERLIAGGDTARTILDRGLLPGMAVVGARMKTGEMFIPEVLLSARIMQSCLSLLKPHLAVGDSGTTGTIVIGTVEGDVHDIGKNLVAMLLEGAGFTVVNLGPGITPQQFVAAVREHKPDIVGMSGLLTTTIPKMAQTISALKDAGLRGTVKVMIGGAPVTQRFADEIGADGYGANAAAAVDRAKELLRAPATADRR
jgi:5-methyltetrahydrofolate--homocysteine methyltransferase